MARFIGLDIGARYVRVAVLTTAYRRVSVERLEEVPIVESEGVRDNEAARVAITTAASHLLAHTDGISVAVEGDQTFTHRFTLPATAAKQLSEVLPFEIEAQVPVDLDDLVYDHRVLPRASNQAPITVLVAAARTDHVRSRIDLVRSALGREPERVACGAMALANLASISEALRGPGPLAILDLGGRRTEITLLMQGQPVYVRTLSRGVEGLPETAGLLAAEVRQSLLAWSAQGGADVQAVFLAGGGAFAEGADRFLSHELELPVTALPELQLAEASPELISTLPRFAKAIALALGSAGRGHDVDLRRGPLAYQRGFGFLKEKAPLLVGLGSATLVSFLFATWAESRALSRENAVLTEQLAVVSKEVLGTTAEDAESALAALEKLKAGDEIDPLPQMDAFDVIVELSKAIPANITHDIEEFDMQRGHVKLQAIAGTANEAQTIATEVGKRRCLEETKLGRVSAQINSDRQKYVLDIDVRCPDEKKAKKKKADESAEKKDEKAEEKQP
ncbi:MAG: pilus assembly protein PilM [Myxococcota bacterium]